MATAGLWAGEALAGHAPWRPRPSPLEMVKAGDHCDLRMSRQMLPLLLMLGW